MGGRVATLQPFWDLTSRWVLGPPARPAHLEGHIFSLVADDGIGGAETVIKGAKQSQGRGWHDESKLAGGNAGADADGRCGAGAGHDIPHRSLRRLQPSFAR